MALLEALYPLIEVSRLTTKCDDDFIDRLNNRYSMLLFIILGVVISTRQYVGDPISCWAPADFSHEWVEYTNQICWISNTYYVPMDQRIPHSRDNRTPHIAYYQWVPLMIFLQALLFFAPSVIWRKLNALSGIHINKIVTTVRKIEYSGIEIREAAIRYIVQNLDRALLSQREYRRGCFVNFRQKLAKSCCLLCGKRYGNYLISLYMFVKLLYIANSVGQLFLLNEFLGHSFYLYGFQVMGDIVQGRNWTTSKRFPRVTLCDFQIRSLGNSVHDHTVQCALPINLFNEKIFIFIWFWLVIISAVTLGDIVAWAWTLFVRNRRAYVRKHLKIAKRNLGRLEEGLPGSDFYDDYLRQDGVFILRLIAKNTNDVIVGEILSELWKNYTNSKQTLSKADI